MRACRGSAFCRISSTGLGGRRARELNGDNGTKAGIAFNQQLAAVKFHQLLGDGQAQAESLFILHFSLELHVGAHTADLFGRESAAIIAHGECHPVRVGLEANANRLADVGEFQRVLHEFDGDFFEIILGHGQGRIRQVEEEIVQ